MSFDKLYNTTVKNCSTCKGTGTVNKTDKSIAFCHCMKFYIFAVRNMELGVPFSYVLGVDNTLQPLKAGVYSFFKQEKIAFDYFMMNSMTGNCKIISATEMYLLNDFRELDLLLIYNLGLENFQNNSATLFRIMNECRTRNVIAILSFSIDKMNLIHHYSKSVVDSVNAK